MYLKTMLFAVFSLLFFVNGRAQTLVHNKPVKLIETPKVEIDEDASGIIYLPMEFNNEHIKSRLNKCNIDDITSISLVYTKYKLNDMFNQAALNKRRLNSLYAAFPNLKTNKEIQWYWVRQTECESPEECEGFFHGFIIKYQTKEEKTRTMVSLKVSEYYTSLYGGGSPSTKTLDSLIATKTTGLIRKCDTVSQTIRLRKFRGGNTLNRSHRSKKKVLLRWNRFFNGDTIKEFQFVLSEKGKMEFKRPLNQNESAILKELLNQYTFYNYSKGRKKINTMFTIKTVFFKGRYSDFIILSNPMDAEYNILNNERIVETKKILSCHYYDSSLMLFSGMTFNIENTVTEVFDRNEHWKNCLIATDVTGSMGPYIGQFLAWHALSAKVSPQHKDFVFFNDGNNMADGLKVAGKVGGVYYIQSNEHEKVKKTLTLAQNAGGGGDGPENNIEAVIDGLKSNPDLKEVIMIADNWATPRDLKLLKKVTVPIHVILCGTYGSINTEYINMAYANGGTIHTIEDDLTELAKLAEGQVVVLLGKKYKLQSGKFLLTE
jgi:hypothetical protein